MSSEASPRTRRRTGSTVVTAAELDPVGAAYDEEKATEASSARDRASYERKLCARVQTATGWDVTAGQMYLKCTKPGFGPVAFHRSTLEEAAQVAIETLTDSTFIPVKVTETLSNPSTLA